MPIGLQIDDARAPGIDADGFPTSGEFPERRCYVDVYVEYSGTVSQVYYSVHNARLHVIRAVINISPYVAS